MATAETKREGKKKGTNLLLDSELTKLSSVHCSQIRQLSLTPKAVLHTAFALGLPEVSQLLTRCPYKQGQDASKGHYALKKKKTTNKSLRN